MPARPQPADELAARIDATERLLQQHKYRHAQLMLPAEEGGEVAPEAASVLRTITKLEMEVANLRDFMRVRDLTREPR